MSPARRSARLHGREDPQRLRPVGPWIAHGVLQARDALDVVRQDVGPCGEDHRQKIEVPAKVRDEHLHEGVWILRADLADTGGEVARALIGLVVPIHGGHHHIVEPHLADSIRDVRGLSGVERGGVSGGRHGAEPAAAGAGVPHHHEGGGAAAPALPDVGALGLLTHRVQLELPGTRFDLRVPFALR